MEPKRISKTEIEFNGVIYRKYPNAKGINNVYYYSHTNKQHRFLHREVYIYHNGTIPKGFHIHHISPDTDNNSNENLQCLSASEHNKIHYKARRVKCTVCGKMFYVRSIHKAKYCSNNCASKARRESKVDNEKRICVICGKDFDVNKYKKTKTCSLKCGSALAYKTKKQGYM